LELLLPLVGCCCLELLLVLLLVLIQLWLLQDRHACVAQLLLRLLLLVAAVLGLDVVLLLGRGLLQGRHHWRLCRRIALLLCVLCPRCWLL
jgi:hypothetical protein